MPATTRFRIRRYRRGVSGEHRSLLAPSGALLRTGAPWRSRDRSSRLCCRPRWRSSSCCSGCSWKRDPIRDRDAHMEATYSAIITGRRALPDLGVHLAVLFALTSQLQSECRQGRGARRSADVRPHADRHRESATAPQTQPRHRHSHSAHVVRSSRVGAHTPLAGYATVVAGSSFLIGGLLPSLPVMEFATIAAIIVTTLAWTSWRARHA